MMTKSAEQELKEMKKEMDELKFHLFSWYRIYLEAQENAEDQQRDFFEERKGQDPLHTMPGDTVDVMTKASYYGGKADGLERVISDAHLMDDFTDWMNMCLEVEERERKLHAGID